MKLETILHPSAFHTRCNQPTRRQISHQLPFHLQIRVIDTAKLLSLHIYLSDHLAKSLVDNPSPPRLFRMVTPERFLYLADHGATSF